MCSSPTPHSKQPEWELDFLCLHSCHLLWYVAYNGYSIHKMQKNSTLRNQLLRLCHTFPLLELFHHYLTSAFVSSNIFLSPSFFSVHKVFLSLSPSLKRQSPFLGCCLLLSMCLEKAAHSCVVHVITSLHSLTHRTLASVTAALPKFLMQSIPVTS